MIVFLVLFALSMINSIVRWVPQVGTYGESKKIIEEEIPSMIVPGSKLLDLGSGTGKMSRFFASTCKVSVVGYEIDISNWIIARVFMFFSGTQGIVFRRWNFWNITQEEMYTYDYVYIYLFPELMRKVETRLVPKMKPGTTVIVNSFAFPTLKPTKTFHRSNGKPIVYIYTV